MKELSLSVDEAVNYLKENEINIEVKADTKLIPFENMDRL